MKSLDDVLWVRAFAHGQEMGVSLGRTPAPPGGPLSEPDVFHDGFVTGYLEAMRNIQSFIDMSTSEEGA